MDIAEIRLTVAKLEGLIEEDGAWLHTYQHGGGPDESAMVGNRAGYLCMALAILKGATTDNPNGSKHLPFDFDYLINEGSDVRFDHLELDEGPRKGALQRSPNFRDRLLAGGCTLFLLALAALLIVGLVTTAKWLAHLL